MRKILCFFLFWLSIGGFPLRSSAQVATNMYQEVMSVSPTVYLPMKESSGSFFSVVDHSSFSPAGAGAAGLLYAQTGFDTSNPGQIAASVPYNAKLVAPNNTLGDFEWTQPSAGWAVLNTAALTRTNYTRVPIMTKGVLGSNYQSTNSWAFFIYWQPGPPALMELCFVYGNAGGCTNSSVPDIVNGASHTLAYSYSGADQQVTLYVDGIGQLLNVGAGTALGNVSLSISGGTGYANSTAFTSTGGSTYCHVAGTIAATSGVPTGSVTYTQNSGCQPGSSPTIVLTSPTGSGVTITPTINAATISTASTYPLELFGDATDALVGQVAVHNASPLIWSDAGQVVGSPLPPQFAINSWTHLKQWRLWAGAAKPANPPTVIVDEDGCQDIDNFNMTALAVRMHSEGYMQLVGVNLSSNSAPCAAMYRQLLDNAGLAHVPLSVDVNALGTSNAYTNNTVVAAQNPNTPTANAAYMSGVTMYRQVIANLAAGQQVAIVTGGNWKTLAAFMQSGADGISSLTGVQMWATKVKGVWAQMANGSSSFSQDNNYTDVTSGQYVYGHNVTVPINLYGTEAFDTGPAGTSRGVHDPLYLAQGVAGTDRRTGYDSWPLAALLDTQGYFFTTPVNGTLTENSNGSGSFSSATQSYHFIWSLNSANYIIANNTLRQNSLINAAINSNPQARK